MSAARYVVGDVFDVLATIPDASVDLVLTSPPFLALRSYLPPDHPDKAKEIGSEPTPPAFLDTMLALSAEWRRVLAPHGSLAVELGDTYSGSGGAGGDYNALGMRADQPLFRQSRNGRKDDWPLPKSLCGIPTLYAWSLAYGRNLLTGTESPAGQWRIRNLIAWCRPNPPVGALGDKVRPATSYVTTACTGGARYFDLDAVRTAHKTDPATYRGNGYSKNAPQGIAGNEAMPGNPNGAPPLDWWEIPTEPYSGSHYATWPTALCARIIKLMCPQRVCRECGKPSERVSNGTEYRNASGQVCKPQKWTSGVEVGAGAHSLKPDGRYAAIRLEGGWTDCGHNAWRNGLVLDPFAGSGTTLEVATGHGLDAVGIDLDERNADLAYERVGMFLTVEHHREAVA